MGSRSNLSSAQLADIDARQREGRPDIAAMSNEERRAAGLMTVGQAAEHERLRSLPHSRLADRVRGPQPDDIWATDEHEAWRQSVQGAWEAAGHYERSCSGWLDDVNGNVICATCLEAVPPAALEPDAASHLRPPFGDDLGFLDPVRAAMHATVVQGGFTTPPIEAHRMIRDGGTAEVRARAWLAGQGLDPDDPYEGKQTPWPMPEGGEAA